MEMNGKGLFFCIITLTGCVHTSPYYRQATLTLNNDQPCIAVKSDPSVNDGDAIILALSVAQRDASGQMHTVWQADKRALASTHVQPGECLPFSYRFEPDIAYSVTIVTAGSPHDIDTKRVWLKDFTLSELMSD